MRENVLGAVVPAGSHEIVFRYRPRSVGLGAAISVVGLVAVGWLARGAPARHQESANAES